jgi:hypothetical protein
MSKSVQHAGAGGGVEPNWMRSFTESLLVHINIEMIQIYLQIVF